MPHHSQSPPEPGRVPPLAGIRVADFSRVLAGPLCSMMLADFGADVIKVESPSGDDTRSWTPPVAADGTGTYFAAANRNKRSVVMDLKTPEGVAAARELAAGADVVIENFRPGVMARFGLDYPVLAAANPRLVYCSITGFGTEQGARLPGYDLLVQALGGLMSITGAPGGEPYKVGVALVDVLTGQNALAGILLALRSRDATGTGQLVEVNLLSSLLAGLVNQGSAALATGVAPRRMGNAHPSIAPYETFRTAAGELALAVGNDRQFSSLAAALGLPELTGDERFHTNSARVAAREELKAILEQALSARPAAEWQQVLMSVGVPAGKVHDVREALDFATDLGLEPSVSLHDPAAGRRSEQLANPIRLSNTPATYRLVPPRLDEHQGIAFEPTQTTADSRRTGSAC